MEYDMKGRLIGIVVFTESLGGSISDWFGKIIGDHNCMFLI